MLACLQMDVPPHLQPTSGSATTFLRWLEMGIPNIKVAGARWGSADAQAGGCVQYTRGADQLLVHRQDAGMHACVRA